MQPAKVARTARKAAAYYRSSKDRSEIGLDTQRRELATFAEQNGLSIVAEYSDMEVSGSLDETGRPGLNKMLAALDDPSRQWETILALDSSRIARKPQVGLHVVGEAERRGVIIQYAKMPLDASTAYGEFMLGVDQQIARLHARQCAEKGHAGLITNLEHGFRAGGRAPLGYKLQHLAGGMRGSKQVFKSKLVLDPKAAPKVKTFLEARAAGVGRTEAAKAAKLHTKAAASLINIERNALTYAGYLSWNQRKKKKPDRHDPRRTMLWRPREEWRISEKPIHEALITRHQAELILAFHETITKPKAPRVRRPEQFILSGLLFTPDGKQWWGDAHESAYRAGPKGRRINSKWVEGSALLQIAKDFSDPDFLARTVAEARRMADTIETDPEALDGEIRQAERRLANLVNALADGETPKPILAKIQEMEHEIAGLKNDKAEWAERAALKNALLAIDAKNVRNILAVNGLEVRDGGGFMEFMNYSPDEMPVLEAGALRRLLLTLLERIELDPATREFKFKYRLPVSGVKLASPRGFVPCTNAQVADSRLSQGASQSGCWCCTSERSAIRQCRAAP